MHGRPSALHCLIIPAGCPARALGGSYGANFPALVVAKGQTARLAYLREFVEEAKASGLVQRTIERAGQAGYQVAR